MTDAQRSYMHARNKVMAQLVDPIMGLMSAAQELVNESDARAKAAEEALELSPLDLTIATASAPLRSLWFMLGAANQTEAVMRLQALKDKA